MGLSSLAIQENSVSAHVHTGANRKESSWMPGQAFKVIGHSNVHILEGSDPGLSLSLLGNSFSSVRLMAMVDASVGLKGKRFLSGLRWEWKHGAGVQLHGMYVHDGHRQLHYFPALSLMQGQVKIQPEAAIEQQLVVFFNIEFSDSDRELHWHSLECEFA